MIRPITLVTAMLAALSGAYLFGVKHRAQVLDDQLAAVAQNSRLDEQRIRVLQAQWALEIDPNRLQQLAGAFTSLQPMKPAQLVTLADLRAVLPPPGSAAPGANPAAPAPADIASNQVPAPAAPDQAVLPMPPPAAPAPAPDAPVPAALPSLPAAPHIVVASAGPRPARVTRVAAHPPRARHTNQGEARWAESQPAPQPLYTAAATAGAPLGARVVSVSTAPQPDANGGSLLGMAADMNAAQGVGN